MQAALDATALAMSKEAANLTAAQLTEKSTAYFNAAFNRPEMQNVRITATYSTTGGSSVTVSGTGEITTQFMGILGINTIPLGSSAKTAWGSGKLRVALVLDNSGSMGSGGRMTALKTATKNLLDKLKAAAAKPGDVQVAIIPFNKYVNAGPGNHSANWINWSDWDSANGSYGGGGGFCFGEWCWVNGSWVKKPWVPDNHDTWNGCVTDRDQDHDVKNTAPTVSDASTLFPAEQGDPCPATVLGLGYDWNALSNKVDGMSSNGTTNQPIGLAWGWMALSQGAPLGAPPLTDDTTQHFIILLSDGENTENRWYSGSSAEAKINARQTKICDNIKAAGIQIYTVLLIDGNADLMRSCASKSDMFFHLTTSGQVISAFDAIGTALSKLRIAQ